MFTEALGWAAASLGALTAVPQVLHILHTKTTAGVSAFAWQLALAANISWISHGFLSGHVNIWLPNVVLLGCTVAILALLYRDRSLKLLPLVAPGALLGATTIGLDLRAGPVVFGMAALLPSAVSQLAQLHDLLLSVNIRGVSIPFLALSVTNQVLWVTWAAQVGETSVLIVGSTLGTLMSLNLAWGTLRRLGLVRARLALLHA